MTQGRTAIVVGAGAGGLATAVDLAVANWDVTVIEASSQAGGKMRQVNDGQNAIDAGPTVFTMRWVFEQLFANANGSFDTALEAVPAQILARHGWSDGSQLDLYTDHTASRAAIAAFASEADASGFDSFCQRAESNYRVLRDSFMAAQQPSMLSLPGRVGLRQLPDLIATRPDTTLWRALDRYFSDPRLKQLFGRYATYVGSSPMLCPATLMLIAHVEQEGVWQLPGGMQSLADAMVSLGRRCNVDYRFETQVTSIDTQSGSISGVTLNTSEQLKADVVVFAGDCNAVAEGLLGESIKASVKPRQVTQRGLSAVTWCLTAETEGFDLEYHNVFFDENYPSEFDAIFTEQSITQRPTVYVCAQDRVDGHKPTGPERLLILINAPAIGDTATPSDFDHSALWQAATAVMARSGCRVKASEMPAVVTDPIGFHALFPGSAGSLYGGSSHGMLASFTRASARTKQRGLYLAGGTVHPGPGVPMATLSGRLAAEAIIQDYAGK